MEGGEGGTAAMYLVLYLIGKVALYPVLHLVGTGTSSLPYVYRC